MKVIYVAGPYRADSEWGVVQNIRRAEAAALDIWRMGAVALCPHKNTALFGGACPDSVWLEGDMELLRRCDAVLLVEGWDKSSGTLKEIDFAQRRETPVFERLDTLKQWLEANHA